MNISYFTLLLIDNPYATAVGFGKTFRPNILTDKLVELDVVAVKTSVSSDFKKVGNKKIFNKPFLVHDFCFWSR